MDCDQAIPAASSRIQGKGVEEAEEEPAHSGGGVVVVVLLVGPPGSGKSTFCDAVMRSAARPWARVCQDTIGNGKTGTKLQCLKAAADAVREGKSVLIDRCNLEREQRTDFVKLGNTMHADVHAVILDLPAKVCISRSVKRTGHEGNLQGGKAALVVNRMLQKKELPKLIEGFARITFCQDDNEVKDVVNMYTALRPSDSLASGVFGQRSKEAVQLGIMKFLKKAGGPSVEKSNGSTLSSSESKPQLQIPSLKLENDRASPCFMQVENESEDKKETEGESTASNSSDISAHTLAFPSISTADFQFDIERASEIIVEMVADFVQKFDNIRLVLVDLSQKSRILSLVRDKAARKNIDSSKFFTFVGDITQLYSKGGLRCNVIANAANWRLKPGGGGVNAAIFNAAGEALQHATKERADTLRPGTSVAVPLPSTSSLHQREGVTHVIHMLGPNMNPLRPDCLNNDYTKGSRILREAYSSLFENFASIVQNHMKCSTHIEGKTSAHSDPKIKRVSCHDSERTKKHKWFRTNMASEGQHDQRKGPESRKYHDNSASSSDSLTLAERADTGRKIGEWTKKSWGSWALALQETAMHPEKHEHSILETTDEFVVLNDLYPKAKKHILVVSRLPRLDCLSEVKKEHLPLLKSMHSAGVKWVQKFLHEDTSLTFRLGYHSIPSMRQLHLHVISQDFNSPHLKNKKHWNSFTTVFFRDSVVVIEEIGQRGSATINGDEKLLSMELRCHRCRSAHPNIPRLKSHIASCRASFPSLLLQKGHLLSASTIQED